jgi:hypothetical protein
MKLLRTKYNDYDLSDLPNPFFQDLREMSENDLNDVAEQIRLGLLKKWQTNKQPLGGGKKTDEKIIKDFRELSKFNDDLTLVCDDEGNRNIVKFFGKQPSGINQYFPEMLDTPISLGNKSVSVMDVIKTTDVFQKFFYSVVFKDRMYSFTMWYNKEFISQETWDLLGDKIPIQLDDVKKSEYGYKLPFFFKKGINYYKLEDKNDKTNSKYIDSTEKEYNQSMKIFPQITQSFRLGGGSQPVSNFSAGGARFLIRKGFQNAIDNNLIENDTFVVLDPSTGWAGRLVGLLSVYTELRKLYFEKNNKQLRVVYLTTDPNEEINDRYNDIIEDWFTVIEPTAEKSMFRIFKDMTGSETPEFLDYCKDKLSKLKINGCTMGLTSPPYFNRERYSKDQNQSWVKYGSSYESWSKGFLKPTIENISQLMVDGGIFYMNIADIKHNSKLLSLEQDTIDGGDEYGCSSTGVYKMLMSTMTGNNKNKETGGQPKNTVKIMGDGFRKFEPIFILKKGAKSISNIVETKTVDTVVDNPPKIDLEEEVFSESKIDIELPSGKKVVVESPTQEELDDFLNDVKPNEKLEINQHTEETIEKLNYKPQSVDTDDDDDWFDKLSPC